jgi:hypothetical protein
MTLTFTDDERATLAEIRRAGAFVSDEDAIRGALFWFGRFLDVDVPIEQFALASVAPSPDADQPDLFTGDWGV